MPDFCKLEISELCEGFSTPDEIARFKSVQWIIGYVLGMGIGPVYAALFDASATTYLSRTAPNFLACTCMIIQCLHVRFIMYPYMRVAWPHCSASVCLLPPKSMPGMVECSMICFSTSGVRS